MREGDEIPEGVSADSSVLHAERLASYLRKDCGARMSYLTMRERDGRPVIVQCSAGAPPPLWTPGLKANLLASMIVYTLARHGFWPAGDEAAVEIEDQDGGRLGYALVRCGTAEMDYFDSEADLYDCAGVKVGASRWEKKTDTDDLSF